MRRVKLSLADRNAHVFKNAGAIMLIWAALSLLVGIPPYPNALFTDWHIGISMEIAIVLGVIAAWQALGLPATRVLVVLASVVVVLTILVRLADMTARGVVARPLNIILDVTLIPALFHVVQTTAGYWGAAGLVAAAAAAIIIMAFLVYWMIGNAAERFKYPATRFIFAGAALVGAVVYGFQLNAGPVLAGYYPINDGATHAWQAQARQFADNRRRRTEFVVATADDPLNDWPSGTGETSRLFDKLDGADVLLIYIESYGRSAVEDELYTDTFVPLLETLDERFAEDGLHSRSGWMTAPMVGGQSWLAHATMLSGLWINDQAFFHLLVAEPRVTLVDMFNRAGYRTAAYMPAITLPWPEGRRYNFDRIYEVRDMPYTGPTWYWGTVPDQWVLDFMERGERSGAPGIDGIGIGDPDDRPPLFAMAALISSHAPWLPTPEVVPWEELGDGQIYERWANVGDPPHVVWRDQSRIQEKYRQSVAYSIEAVGDYVANFADDETLVIFLGDHQPATLITGMDASFDVPVHVVSGNPNLVDAFAELDFRPGLVPGPDAAVHTMDIFRNWMVTAFSTMPQSDRETILAETGTLSRGIAQEGQQP
jgi:hypothetical protein